MPISYSYVCRTPETLDAQYTWQTALSHLLFRLLRPNMLPQNDTAGMWRDSSDWTTYGIVAAGYLIAQLIASWLPAGSSTKIITLRLIMSAISYCRVVRKDALNRRLDRIDKQTVDCYMYYLHGLLVVYLVTRLLHSLPTSSLTLICNPREVRTFSTHSHFTVYMVQGPS